MNNEIFQENLGNLEKIIRELFVILISNTHQTLQQHPYRLSIDANQLYPHVNPDIVSVNSYTTENHLERANLIAYWGPNEVSPFCWVKVQEFMDQFKEGQVLELLSDTIERTVPESFIILSQVNGKPLSIENYSSEFNVQLSQLLANVRGVAASNQETSAQTETEDSIPLSKGKGLSTKSVKRGREQVSPNPSEVDPSGSHQEPLEENASPIEQIQGEQSPVTTSVTYEHTTVTSSTVDPTASGSNNPLELIGQYLANQSSAPLNLSNRGRGRGLNQNSQLALRTEGGSTAPNYQVHLTQVNQEITQHIAYPNAVLADPGPSQPESDSVNRPVASQPVEDPDLTPAKLSKYARLFAKILNKMADEDLDEP
jgi:hypothetical protein